MQFSIATPTMQFSRHPVIIPGQHPVKVPKLPRKKRRVKRHPGNVTSRSENDALLSVRSMPDTKLEPLANENLSLEVLNQYNDIVDEDRSLTIRTLPPIKLSIKSTKNKFMETPRGDPSSRILQPHVTLKTHSSGGHHVFTEGISRCSEMPLPPFALQKLQVPYSNLPDNVTIYKERNTFAFGIKDEERNPSPYKLTPRPTGIQKQITDIPSFTKTKRRKKMYTSGSSDGLTSNTQEHVLSSDLSNHSSFHEPSKEFKGPSQSIPGTECPTRNGRNESRLSIVSLGESITPTYFDRQKRKTRQMFPMYDNKFKKHEQYRKEKFSDDVNHLKGLSPSKDSNFTYKIRSRHLSEPSESISPIKNNLKPIYMHRQHYGQIALSIMRSYPDEFSSSDLDNLTSRRSFHKRQFHRQKSADSNSSTDLSHFPLNPPPSEISHHVSEDFVQTIPDLRNEMVTLHEERERTMTASIMSATQKPLDINDGLNIVPAMLTNVENVTPDQVKDVTDKWNSEGIIEQIDAVDHSTDIVFHKVGKKETNEQVKNQRNSNKDLVSAEGMRKGVKGNTFDPDGEVNSGKVDMNNDNNESMKVEDKNVLKEESEETVQDMIDEQPDGNNETSDSTEEIERYDDHQGESDPSKPSRRQKFTPSKQLLSLPTLSLDVESHLSLLKEKTSLSRSMENMSILDQIPARSRLDIDNDSETQTTHSTDIDQTCVDRIVIPVTRIRLFSESTAEAMPTACVWPDVNSEQPQIFYANDTSKTDSKTVEMKVIANSSISFKSPLEKESKAKRH